MNDRSSTPADQAHADLRAVAGCLAGSGLLQSVAETLVEERPFEAASECVASPTWSPAIASLIAEVGLLDSVARSLGPIAPLTRRVPGQSPRPPLVITALCLFALPGLRGAGAGGGGPGSLSRR